MGKITKSVGLAANFLLELANEIGKVLESVTGEDFLMTPQGMRKIGRGLEMEAEQAERAFQLLKNRKLIKKEGDRYLITPKGYKKIELTKIEIDDWSCAKWDGRWRIVIFDIPETKKVARNALRSFLMRKGFLRLQNSVFVAPYANLEQLNVIRHEYGIAKYVNFLVSQSDKSDDDSNLREKFGLG